MKLQTKCSIMQNHARVPVTHQCVCSSSDLLHFETNISNAFSHKSNGITTLEVWSSGRDRSWALDLLLFALPSTFSSSNGLIKKPESLINNRPYLKLCPKVVIQKPNDEIGLQLISKTVNFKMVIIFCYRIKRK